MDDNISTITDEAASEDALAESVTKSALSASGPDGVLEPSDGETVKKFEADG
jgi:hypothetical protein